MTKALWWLLVVTAKWYSVWKMHYCNISQKNILTLVDLEENWITNYVFLQQVSLIIQIGAFCVAQLKVEIQEGVHVGDQSWSRQLNCHWLKMLSTACHNFVFLVWYGVKPPSFIKKCAVSFRSGQKWFLILSFHVPYFFFSSNFGKFNFLADGGYISMKKKPVECHSLVLTDIEGMSVKFGYTSGLFTVFSLHMRIKQLIITTK